MPQKRQKAASDLTHQIADQITLAYCLHSHNFLIIKIEIQLKKQGGVCLKIFSKITYLV